MSRGISTQQKRILEILALRPEGLGRDVLQAQLWPDLFCTDYRYTDNSAKVVKEKAKCRVILSRAIKSLKRRGLIKVGAISKCTAKDIHALGLRLPYSLQMGRVGEGEIPHYGDAYGQRLMLADAGS